VLKPRRNVTRQALSVAGALANYRIVFANPRTKLLYGLVVIEGILLFGIPAYVAAILFERSGVGPGEAGLAIAGMGFGCLVYGLLTRILVERLGPTRMTRTGGVVCAIGLALFAFDWPWWSAIPLFALQGFGFFLLHGTFQAQATELAPAARGSAMALFACCFFLGQATGPLAMGAAMHALGAPIFGDRIYPTLLPPEPADAPQDFSRPLRLLAREIAFTDPVTGQVRRFTSTRTLDWPDAQP